MKNKGFSLIEVVVAMAVLALVSIPLLQFFSNSMKHTALMAKQQKAVTFAQEQVEDILSVDDLLKPCDTPGHSGHAYDDNYLVASLGYTCASNTTDATTNISELTFANTSSFTDYDVKVSVSTSSPANAKSRNLIYGIDDRSDVLLVEKEQTKEAIAYFLAANTSELSINKSAVPVTAAEIKAALDREMHIDITYDNTNSKYLVKSYYTYTCSVVSSAGAYTPSIIDETSIVNLAKIYLLYEQIDGHNNDKLIFNCDVESASRFSLSQYPELNLVCQNPPVNNAYLMYVTLLDVSQNVRTNIRNDGANAYGNIVSAGAGGSTLSTLKLSDNATDIMRMIDVTVDVYEKGKLTTGTPLASVSTTKGE